MLLHLSILRNLFEKDLLLFDLGFLEEIADSRRADFNFRISSVQVDCPLRERQRAVQLQRILGAEKINVLRMQLFQVYSLLTIRPMLACLLAETYPSNI